MDNEPDNTTSSMQQGQNAPQYNALQSHAGHGQSLGHSVVPDLMKIYESLTQSKTPQTQQKGMGGNAEQHYQQPVPPPPQQMYQNASHFYPPAPAAAPYPYMQAHPQQYNYAAHPPSDLPAPQYAAADYDDDTKEVTSSGRTLRKRASDKVDDDKSSSDGSTSRSRKKKKSDGRWSKRFTWPDDLHRDFVSAVFDVGLKNASPSALLEHMPEHDQITSERVKSHLQKYRLNRAKSKKEFMSCYEASLGNYQASGVKAKSLGSGEVAAQLAYTAMNEPEESAAPVPVQSQSDALQDSAHEMIGTSRGGALILPKLTEAEKQSPLGASMGYMMGLFFALRQQLMTNRAAAAVAAASEGANTSTAPNNQVPFVSYPNSTDTEQADHDGHLHDQNVPTWSPTAGHAMDASQQHVTYQDQSNVAVASKPQASTSRTNLEESNLMKREMRNQMAFQNKMRALKQQELNKTKNTKNGAEQHGNAGDDNGDGASASQTDDRGRIKHDDETSKDGHDDNEGEYQEAGEAAEDGNGHAPGSAARARQRGLSMGASEEFWVNDEQLFEFLMNS